MMEPHAQSVLFDMPATEQVAATLTQTKGLPLPPALGAEIMKSPQMGLTRRVTFTGSGTLERWFAECSDKGTRIEQLTEALRRIEAFTWKKDAYDGTSPQDIARAALTEDDRP